MIGIMGCQRFLCAVLGGLWLSSTVLAAQAYDPQTRHQDNSGRQIAVVVPGMPHPAAAAPFGVPTRSSRLSAPAVSGMGGSFESVNGDRAGAVNRSSVGTPIGLSPKTKEALANGLRAAQGLSAIAQRRFEDLSQWLTILWRQFNDVPRVTPAEPVALPRVSVRDMQPIEETGRPAQLYYTSEQRFRTVVAR